MQAERENIKRDHPEASSTDILKLLGEKWKTADAETKAKYEALYKENKAKADEEMKAYKNSDSFKEFAAQEGSDASSDDEDGKGKSEKKAKKAKKDPNAPKQASSAYILFSQARGPPHAPEPEPETRACEPYNANARTLNPLSHITKSLSP